MVGELVMLPVRVGVRATRLWFRTVEETVSFTATATSRAIQLLSSRASGGASLGTSPGPAAPARARTDGDVATERDAEGDGDRERDTDTDRDREPALADTETARGDREPAGADTEPARPEVEPERADARPPTEGRDFAPPMTQPAWRPPLSAEPAHVSEEPELVEEFSEPGAEEGAGAEVRVDAPWDGYEGMNAKQVISRLASASPAELAAVELYEGTHRRRQTILTAVDRELRHPNGGGSQTQERGSSDG